MGMADEKPFKLAEIAHLRGLGAPLFMGMDTKSKPGPAICHFARFETIEFEMGPAFDNTTFTLLDPTFDARIKLIEQLILR